LRCRTRAAQISAKPTHGWKAATTAAAAKRLRANSERRRAKSRPTSFGDVVAPQEDVTLKDVVDAVDADK
jgi:hypothetical protein